MFGWGAGTLWALTSDSITIIATTGLVLGTRWESHYVVQAGMD
ncbi:MAG: hypothetical protein ACPGJA_03625 [Candidatus Thalassarchaeaceae archaeon]